VRLLAGGLDLVTPPAKVVRTKYMHMSVGSVQEFRAVSSTLRTDKLAVEKECLCVRRKRKSSLEDYKELAQRAAYGVITHRLFGAAISRESHSLRECSQGH
jgi:hypothetical protein